MTMTKKIMIQFERIKQNGYCDMIEYYCVMNSAHCDGYHELSFLSKEEYIDILDNYEKYMKQFNLKPDDESIWEIDIK